MPFSQLVLEKIRRCPELNITLCECYLLYHEQLCWIFCQKSKTTPSKASLKYLLFVKFKIALSPQPLVQIGWIKKQNVFFIVVYKIHYNTIEPNIIKKFSVEKTYLVEIKIIFFAKFLCNSLKTGSAQSIAIIIVHICVKNEIFLSTQFSAHFDLVLWNHDFWTNYIFIENFFQIQLYHFVGIYLCYICYSE